MQRDAALRDLSRDHFVALNHAQAAKRVLEGHRAAEPLDVVWQRFVTWCSGPLLDHLAQEEELLLPLLDAVDHQAHAARLEGDHARLRAELGRMRTETPSEQALWNVAEDLRLHVRWEEEVLFEALQEWLEPEALQDLAAASDRFRSEAGLPLGTQG